MAMDLSNSLLAHPLSPPVFDMSAITPDAAASDAYTDQIRLQTAGIKTQMSNMERDQRTLRQRLHELERFVRRTEQQDPSNVLRRRNRSAKSVQIRVLLHRAPSSSTPSEPQDFTANIHASRAKSIDQLRKAVSEAFEPLMTEATDKKRLRVLEGTMKLKSADGMATDDNSLLYIGQQNRKMLGVRYRSWYKDNVTTVTEEVPEIEIWDQTDCTGQINSERIDSAASVMCERDADSSMELLAPGLYRFAKNSEARRTLENDTNMDVGAST